MNERRNTDELLQEMNETHRNHATKLDADSLLMHALAARPKRSRWAALGWIAAALVIIGIVLKPMLPAMGGKPYVDHNLGGVRVRTFPSPGEYHPAIYHQCSLGDMEFFIVQYEEQQPEGRFAATIKVDGLFCQFFPSDTALVEPNISEVEELHPHIEIVREVSAQMDSVRMWPADLWSIRPFVRKLVRGEYRLAYTEPVGAGYVLAPKLLYGEDVGYRFEAYGLGSVGTGSDEPLPIRLYIWPHGFTLQAFVKPNEYKLYLRGDSRGYDAYQTSERWGEGVREGMSRINDCMRQYPQLLPLLGDEVSSAFAQSLRQTVDVVCEGEPRALYRADDYELYHWMEPWRPAHLDEDEESRQKESLAGLRPEFSFEWQGLTISSHKDWQKLTLKRGDLEFSFLTPYWYHAGVYLRRNDERLLTRMFVLNEGMFPELTCEVRPEVEALLGEVSAMARDALDAPVKLWPAGDFPQEYVTNWLRALRDRRVAVWDSHSKAKLYTVIQREGGTSELIINVGFPTPELNLRFMRRGFELLNIGNGYFVSQLDGELRAVRTAEAKPEVLTPANLRRAETVLGFLSQAEWDIPSVVRPSIDAFHDLLGTGAYPPAELVSELPPIRWSWRALNDRNDIIGFAYSLPTMVQNLERQEASTAEE